MLDDINANVTLGAPRLNDDVDMTDSDNEEEKHKKQEESSSEEEEDHEELSDVFQQQDYLQLFKNGSGNANFR